MYNNGRKDILEPDDLNGLHELSLERADDGHQYVHMTFSLRPDREPFAEGEQPQFLFMTNGVSTRFFSVEPRPAPAPEPEPAPAPEPEPAPAPEPEPAPAPEPEPAPAPEPEPAPAPEPEPAPAPEPAVDPAIVAEVEAEVLAKLQADAKK